MKDEIKEILEYAKSKGYIDLDYEESKLLLDYITNLQDKYERMKENAEILSNGYNDLEKRNEKAIENIDLVIELIKQQPTEDDTWILNKLNGFKYLLQGEDKNE